MVFIEVEQIRVGSDNYSYIIHDGIHGALVDPGFDASQAIMRIEELGLNLLYVIATHHHSDHVHDVDRVIEATGAKFLGYSMNNGDSSIQDGDRIKVGSIEFEFMHTPGHTEDSICVLVENAYLFTGDTLFIDDCGRCDLPGGSLEKMFESLQRLKSLDDAIVVYPGHDYGPKEFAALGEQKLTSAVLKASDLKEFSRM